MSLIDPNLFKGEPETGGPTPFAPGGLAKVPADISTFKDPRPLTGWVSGVVWADVAFSAVLALIMLAQLAGIQMIPLDETVELTPGQLIFTLVAMVYFGLVALRVIIILRWFWRANKNARALSSGLETTPGWAWGFFFIPFMNLFRPFQTMEEIWASSQDPGHWRTVETPVIMRWWWGLWLVGNVFDNLAGRFMDKADTLQIAATVGIIGYGMSIACDICFLRLINPIARNQWAHSQDSVFD